jgi:hypothetical protein
MRICWQSLVPVGIVLLIATGVLVYFGLERNIVACLGVNVILLGILLWNAAASRQPVTGRQVDLPDVEIVART